MREGDLTTHAEIGNDVRVESLIAVGPLERLSGEITVSEGRCSIAQVVDGNVQTSSNCLVKAPFLVWSNPKAFVPIANSISVVSLGQLNSEIESILKGGRVDPSRAIPLKVRGRFKSVRYHVLNLPAGYVGKMSHSEHSKIKRSFTFDTPEAVELVGFFSNQHHGVFVHHGESLHLHMVNRDGSKSGHVEDFEVSSGERLELLVGI